MGRLFAILALVLAPLSAFAQQATFGTGYYSTVQAITLGTAGTFQQVLSSGVTRKGCFIQNTSSENEYVYFGTSPTTAASIQLPKAQALNCNSGQIVAGDAVWMAGSSSSSDTAVVINQ